MKYNQPYGAPGSNDPYVNGNPATGTQGSIPPAAAIEYPQREIVAAISAAGLTPDNADLGQLLKALKNIDVINVFKTSTNTGTAVAWVATIPTLPTMPPPTGTAIWFKPGFVSQKGGTTLSVNGSSFAPVKLADLSDVTVGDVLATAWLQLFFDGTRWIIVGGANRSPGQLPLLQAPQDWYVNNATGNDSTYDGTSPTVSGVHGPFKTMNRAHQETIKYNMNGYNQTVHVADGTYVQDPSTSVYLGPQNGAGQVFWVGNISAPQNVSVSSSGLHGLCFHVTGDGYDIGGFRCTSTGTGDGGHGILVNGGRATIHDMRWGPCTNSHSGAYAAGTAIWNSGLDIIEAGGNAQFHLYSSSNGHLEIYGLASPTVTALNVLGSVNFSNGFVNAGELGIAIAPYSSITGYGNVTGSKFSASLNGVVISGSGGDVNYFPGNSPGVTATGGQYA
jgi:hypothetical protein